MRERGKLSARWGAISKEYQHTFEERAHLKGVFASRRSSPQSHKELDGVEASRFIEPLAHASSAVAHIPASLAWLHDGAGESVKHNSIGLARCRRLLPIWDA